jgi:THAP domain
MSFCNLGGCTSSKRKASLISEEEEEESHDCEQKIILDDEEKTCFDGRNIRFFCMPRLPKLRDNAKLSERAEYKRVLKVRKDWIHAIGRADKLPTDVRICSRHFAPSAYDMLSPMKQGVKTLLEVPTRNLLLPDAIPTENLICSKKSVCIKTTRSKRMKKRDIAETVKNVLEAR